MISKERILELVAYDRKAGKMYWRFTNGRKKQGAEIGCVTPSGYRMVGIDGYKILAHRLVWIIETGSLPKMELDHINRKPDDNRIENLREVTRQQNMRNRGFCKNNKLSLKGVVKHQIGYRARIMHNKIIIDLGMFDTEKEAAIAYTAAERVCETFCQVGI